MTRFFLSIYDFLSKRKALSIALMIALMVVCVLLSLRLRYKENITDFLPANEANKRYMAVYNDMGDRRITVIFHADTTADNSEDIKSAIDRFEEQWYELYADDSIDLTCRADAMLVADAMSLISDNPPLFLNASDYSRIDSLLAIDGYIDTCLVNVKRMLGFPMSAMAVDVITNDPLNLFSPPLQRLSQLSASDVYDIDDEYVFDNKGNAYAFINSPYPSGDTKGNSLLAGMIENTIQKTKVEFPDVGISAVGSPLIAAANANCIKRDSILSISIAVVLIMVVLIVTMGRKRNILWLGFSIAMGWLFALAVIVTFKPAISAVVIGIGSVLIGIAVNYPLHFLDHIRDHINRREALKDMVDPLVTGNITTVSAFACLLFVKAEAMRDLGLFGSLMLIGTILFVMIFLPLFAKAGRKKKVADDTVEGSSPILQNSKWSRYLLLPVCVITIVLGYLSTRTQFDSDLHNINYMTTQQQRDIAMLSSSIEQSDSLSTLYVASEAKSLDEALQNAESLVTDIEGYEGSGPIGLLPSVQQQETALQRWLQFTQRYPDLGEQLENKAVAIGFKPKAFAKFAQHLSSDYAPIPPEQMTDISQLCENYLLQRDSTWCVVGLSKVPNGSVALLKDRINGSEVASKGVFAFDISDVGSNLVTALSDDFNYILYVCGFVVFFFLWLSLGRIELAILSFLPLTVGWLWILGIMDITAVKFNIVNIILATFIFGQGDDYTIFITEGLMYEYAYGKRRLGGYRRSVIVSAVLMFIGIGALIFAKHPAMRSLAQVAIIGMATVVVMACYLPPIVFRWLTAKKGELRDVPITLKRLAYTAWSFLVVFVVVFVTFTPFTLIYKLIGKDTEAKRLRYHCYVRNILSFAIKRIPGTNFKVVNEVGEDFSKPAVIIANHQSHLDLLCILMLHPKMIVMTKDWVWRNLIYGSVIRYAEFYPVSNGYENNLPKLKSLVNRGYSIMIFPEGTRSVDCKIARFHKGAFSLAKELCLDILPVLIHGTGYVMPKNDKVLREGNMTVEIKPRISPEYFNGMEPLKMASAMRKKMVEYYDELCAKCQTEEYYLPLVRYQYLYKGREVEQRCRKALRQWQNGAVEQLGQGEIPLLKALAHPEQEFHYEFDDADDYLVAKNCRVIPDNLHYSLREQ